MPRRLGRLALTLVALGVAGCGDDAVEGPADAGASDAASLPDAAPTDAGSGPVAHVIRFTARAGTEGIACGTSYAGVGAARSQVRIKDFRLFVSNLRLIDAQGAEVPLELEQDGTWQTGQVALLDFEDGSAGCGESGNADLRDTLRGTAPIARPTGLRFDIGLPFEVNHLDATAQPSPLNLISMFWTWRAGYKFARIDLEVNGAVPYNLHVGSVGCVSAAPVVGPPAPCARPNLATVTLEGFDPAEDEVVLDLAALLEGVDLTANTPSTPVGCMSSPTEPADCTTVFANLGLSFETGACVDGCRGQRFVRAE